MRNGINEFKSESIKLESSKFENLICKQIRTWKNILKIKFRLS
jgi:hypothetical protein